jgi:hypothetical protein
LPDKATWLAELRRTCGGLDPSDPQAVPDVAIGKALRISAEERWAIEESQTRFMREQYDKPESYQYRLWTIHPADIPKEEWDAVRKRRKRQKEAAQRKAKRAEREVTVNHLEDTSKRPTTYAEAIAAQKASTELQCSAILDAVGNQQQTTVELMAVLADDPAWRSISVLATTKFRQTIYDRLDMLVTAGKLINLPPEPGPRGSKIRVVSRPKKPSDHPTAGVHGDR